jgi:spermidine/putrescine ABC transporter ATP-binding subunit
VTSLPVIMSLTMNDVLLDHVTFRYGDVVAADNVSLHVQPGEFFALLGPSGSGKTTILRLIAGFLQLQSGAITIGGRNMVGAPPYDRNIGFVFQNYALFPHMTVAQNVAFGLESRHVPAPERQKRVAHALALVQLAGLGERRPAQLSGGQQQRVALARAIVTEPNVLLLDEPLAALDKKLRTEMQVELRDLQQRLGITTLFVTHDQEEALALADRIAVMDHGKIVQVGPAHEVYERPQTHFVTDFLGEANIFSGQVVTSDETGIVIAINEEDRVVAPSQPGLTPGAPIVCAVRPENVRISLDPPSTPIALPATVAHVVYLGPSLNFHLTLRDGAHVVVFAQSGVQKVLPTVGQAVYLWWEPEYTLVLHE